MIKKENIKLPSTCDQAAGWWIQIRFVNLISDNILKELLGLLVLNGVQF